MRNPIATGLVVLGLSTAFLVVEPRSAAGAHDCALDCIDCGWAGWEGDSSTHHSDGQHDFNCAWFECDSCSIEPLFQDEAIVDALIDPMKVLRAAAEAPVSGLGAVVEAYEGRLLLHPARGVATVRGTACSPEALASAVVFLSPEKLTALEELGAETLVEFLATYGE